LVQAKANAEYLATARSSQPQTLKPTPPPEKPALPTFTFHSITLDATGKQTARKPGNATYFSEDLGNGIMLDMVQIPSGPFKMGAATKTATTIKMVKSGLFGLPTVRTVFNVGSGEESYPRLKVQSYTKKDCAMDSLQNILTDALTTVGHFTNRNGPFSSHSSRAYL
jgi:hypothetical protein